LLIILLLLLLHTYFNHLTLPRIKKVNEYFLMSL